MTRRWFQTFFILPLYDPPWATYFHLYLYFQIIWVTYLVLWSFQTPTWRNDPIWVYIFSNWMGWNHKVDNISRSNVYSGKICSEKKLTGNWGAFWGFPSIQNDEKPIKTDGKFTPFWVFSVGGICLLNKTYPIILWNFRVLCNHSCDFFVSADQSCNPIISETFWPSFNPGSQANYSNDRNPHFWMMKKFLNLQWKGPKAYKHRVHLSFGMASHLRCNTPNGARVEAHSLYWGVLLIPPLLIRNSYYLEGYLWTPNNPWRNACFFQALQICFFF